MTRIALVTCAAGRSRDDDLPPLLAALVAHHVGGDAVVAEAVDWDDPAVDWAVYDLAVIRSTWDYTARYDEFLAWVERCSAATTLINDPGVLRWNSDKRYLDELAAAGVRVVPTTFIVPERGNPNAPDAPDDFDLPADVEFVVKPVVSAGSRDTVRYRVGDRDGAAEQIRGLLGDGRVVMVQPYQQAVDRDGETALLFFGGRFSHAIRKGQLLVAGEPATRALFAEEHITPVQPTDAQLRLAEQCLAALVDLPAFVGVAQPLPYARVDVLQANDGEMSILELGEPSLFLGFSDGGAADRYASVLVAISTHRATS